MGTAYGGGRTRNASHYRQSRHPGATQALEREKYGKRRRGKGGSNREKGKRLVGGRIRRSRVPFQQDGGCSLDVVSKNLEEKHHVKTHVCVSQVEKAQASGN